MDVAAIWVRHKKPIIIIAANVLGLLVVVLAAKLLYNSVVVPAAPNPTKVPEKEVVMFLADKKMTAMPKRKQRKYLRNVARYYASPHRRQRFAREIDDLPDLRRHQLFENVKDVAKGEIIEYSDQYSKIDDRDERMTFVDDKIDEMESLRTMLRGPRRNAPRAAGGNYASGSNRSADLANTKIAKEVPSDPKTIYKKFLDETNPVQRAKLKPYLDDVQARLAQLRAIRKAQQ